MRPVVACGVVRYMRRKLKAAILYDIGLAVVSFLIADLKDCTSLSAAPFVAG